MITIRIPKDIREYKEKILAGLTIRQLICTIITLGIVVPLYFLGSGVIPDELLSWTVILIAAPIVSIGFIKIHKMPFEKFIVHFFRQLFLVPLNRVFKNENDYREWIMQYNKEHFGSSERKVDKQASLTLVAAVGIAFFIIRMKSKNKDEMEAEI